MRRRFRHEPRRVEPGCPTWCDRDHALDLDVDRDGVILHIREFGRGVELVSVTDVEGGYRTAAEVAIAATSCETGTEVRRLVLAVLDAGDYLDGADR